MRTRSKFQRRGTTEYTEYVGLNPAFDDSGEAEWHGGIGGQGHKSPPHPG